MVAEWLAHRLRSERDLAISGHGVDVASAAGVIRRQEPQLVITELSLPDAPGMEVLRALNRNFPSLPVLVFSRHDEEQCAEAAIAAGARGFVSKRESGAVVKLAIRRVLSGDIYLSSEIAAQILHSFARGQRSATTSPAALLSRRELELFALIGEGCKPSEIAQRMGVGVKTIESYSTRIREKLGLKGARDLFRSALDWARRPIK